MIALERLLGPKRERLLDAEFTVTLDRNGDGVCIHLAGGPTLPAYALRMSAVEARSLGRQLQREADNFNPETAYRA